MIRKQLNDPPTAARRTAVTDGKPPSTQTGGDGEPATSTGLFRKLGADGVASLEIDNTKVAAPRARRNSEQIEVMPGDTDVHRLFEQSQDKDRHTEVGGPPTGQVPKDYEPPEPAADPGKGTGTTKSITADVTTPPPRRTALWIVVGVAVVGGGAGIYAVTRKSGPEDQPIVDRTPKDAAVIAPATTATVYLVTTPAGATGTIDGTPLSTPTPVRATGVPVGKAKIHLQLPGFLPLDYDLDVVAGNNNDNRAFVAAPARLHVTTEPVGAQVTLAGRGLGVTPLTRTDLSAVKGATLTLSKIGFESLSFKIDLEADHQLEIDKTLKAAQKFAMVQMRVIAGPKVGWGWAYLNGKKIGRAPSPGLKLPVGKVSLHFVNDSASPAVQWDADCDVAETGTNICVIKVP